MAEPVTIILETPIIRGDKEITEITLRPPKAGELRGLSLTSILQMDVTAVSKLLPRISSPTLTETDCVKMGAADFTQLATQIAYFFLTRAQLTAAETDLKSDFPSE